MRDWAAIASRAAQMATVEAAKAEALRCAAATLDAWDEFKELADRLDLIADGHDGKQGRLIALHRRAMAEIGGGHGR